MSKRSKVPVKSPLLTRTPRPADLPEFFLRVRQAEASKLGLRAHGNIVYQTLIDPDRQRVFLRVVANSGSGSFSDEPVHVDKLAEAVGSRDITKPLRGSVLQGAIVGKSVCNAGFFAAVLVAEGLLGRDAAKRFDLLDLERWQAWTAEQLACEGELTEVRLKSDATDAKKPASVVESQTEGEVGADPATDPVTADAASSPTEAADGSGEGHSSPGVDGDEVSQHVAHRRGKGRG